MSSLGRYVLPCACARACVCVRARARGFGHTRVRTGNDHSAPPPTVASSSAADRRVVVGSQAFAYEAIAFNAAIGAWNTASLTSLAYVCAAFGPAARLRRRTRSAGFNAARLGCGLRCGTAEFVCAAALPMMSRARGCAGAFASALVGRGCTRVYI